MAGMKGVSMDGEKTLSKVSLPEVILDDACRIGVSQSLRQRYYIPQIKENFKARIAAIKESLDDDDVCISIRTISLQKGTDTYNFRVHGQRTKTVLLKNKNGVCHTLLDINELMKELAELFETTCYFAAGKYKAPMRCGITIK